MRKQTTTADLKRWRELKSAGLTLSEIAERDGCSRNTVWRNLSGWNRKRVTK